MFRWLEFLRLELRATAALSGTEAAALRRLEVEDEQVGDRLAAWDVFGPIGLYLLLVLIVGFGYVIR